MPQHGGETWRQDTSSRRGPTLPHQAFRHCNDEKGEGERERIAKHYCSEGKIPSESPAGTRMYVFPLKLSLSSSPSAATEGPDRPGHFKPNAVINGIWLFCCAAFLGMSGIDCFGFCFASPDGWEPESLTAGDSTTTITASIVHWIQ